MKDDRGDITEKDIIQRLKAGDHEAFGWLVERYKKMGFSLVYNMLGSVEDAEDISQEAFAIVYSEIKKFRGESSFKTWFYRIIVNLCRRHYRKNRFASFISLNFFTKEGEEKTIDAAAETTPEDELSTKQLGSAIKKAGWLFWNPSV
jgi:RNA polymerase sigma-70 factor (ECF subfamily)